MTEVQKQKAIMDYFDKTIFEPAVIYGKINNLMDIVRGVNLTRARMRRLSSEKMIQYFWSAIIGTDKSIRFSKMMKEHNILRFEDIIEEVREKFNNEWLAQ